MIQNPPLMEQALARYVTVFEQLSPETLHSELAELLDDDISFKDPFNDVTGKAATLHIFDHMFATLRQPRFVVIRSVQQGEWAYLDWRFHFLLPSSEEEKSLEGLSRVKFNSAGQIVEHIDFWDAGEQVYAKVPILGWGIRQVAKRLQANG